MTGRYGTTGLHAGAGDRGALGSGDPPGGGYPARPPDSGVSRPLGEGDRRVAEERPLHCAGDAVARICAVPISLLPPRGGFGTVPAAIPTRSDDMASHATGDGGIPPRDAAKRGLKRIMTLGGAYGTRNYTVKDLRDRKGRRVLVETLPFSPEEAAAAEGSRHRHHEGAFRSRTARARGGHPASRPQHVHGPSPCRSWPPPPRPRRCGWATTRWPSGRTRSCASGAPASWPRRPRRGFPSRGTRAWCREGARGPEGCARVGKTLDEALWIYHEIKALENAGAYAVEVEVIPAELLAEISKRTTLLTSSIGAGSGGDIQFLFAEDVLGNDPPPYPRHSKQYRHLYKLKERMQAERVPASRNSPRTSGKAVSPGRSTSSMLRKAHSSRR